MNYGLVKLRLASGVELTVRGGVMENPADISVEPVVNTDGSVDGTVTAMGYRGKFTLAARTIDGTPVDVGALLRLQQTSVTFISEAEHSLRSYSGVSFHGDPEVDVMTGELTGIMFTARGRLLSTLPQQ